jgi:phosphoribosyl-ATP pyrophosphohydrolase
MTGEAGEAANAAKKLKRLDGGLKSINEAERHYANQQAASAAVAKEVADTIIYGLLLMARVGITDPESVIREVFNKKSEEYGFVERV